MCPVVFAAVTFDLRWAGKVVQFVVDNEAVVEVIKATYSKDLHLMHLTTSGSQRLTFKGNSM